MPDSIEVTDGGEKRDGKMGAHIGSKNLLSHNELNRCDECMLAFAPFSQRLSRLCKLLALSRPMSIAPDSGLDQRQTRYTTKIFWVCGDQRSFLQHCGSGNERIG